LLLNFVPLVFFEEFIVFILYSSVKTMYHLL